MRFFQPVFCNFKLLSLIFFFGLSLGGCTILTSQTAEDLIKSEQRPKGVYYSLPKGVIDVTLSVNTTTAEFSMAIGDDVRFEPDPKHRYFMHYQSLPNYHDTIDVKVGPKHFIQEIDVTARDKTGAIIVNLAEAFGAATGSLETAATPTPTTIELFKAAFDPTNGEKLTGIVKKINSIIDAYIEDQKLSCRATRNDKTYDKLTAEAKANAGRQAVRLQSISAVTQRLEAARDKILGITRVRDPGNGEQDIIRQKGEDLSQQKLKQHVEDVLETFKNPALPIAIKDGKITGVGSIEFCSVVFARDKPGTGPKNMVWRLEDQDWFSRDDKETPYKGEDKDYICYCEFAHAGLREKIESKIENADSIENEKEREKYLKADREAEKCSAGETGDDTVSLGQLNSLINHWRDLETRTKGAIEGFTAASGQHKGRGKYCKGIREHPGASAFIKVEDYTTKARDYFHTSAHYGKRPGTWSSLTTPAHLKLAKADCATGVCYRAKAPFRIDYHLMKGKAKQGVGTKIVELPNLSPVVAIDLRRAFLVEKVMKVHFDENGFLSKAYTNKPSELVAATKLPLDVMDAILDGFKLRFDFISAQKNVAAKEVEALKAKQALANVLQPATTSSVQLESSIVRAVGAPPISRVSTFGSYRSARN